MLFIARAPRAALQVNSRFCLLLSARSSSLSSFSVYNHARLPSADAGPNLMCSALLLSVAVLPVRRPPGFDSLCSVPTAANPEVMCLPVMCFSLVLLFDCRFDVAPELQPRSERCHLHASLFLFQAMKPTRTSSETFHTWPQTTPRSSNAAVPTSDSEPPQSACVEQMRAHVQESLRAHLVLATCHTLGHSSAGGDCRRVKEL